MPTIVIPDEVYRQLEDKFVTLVGEGRRVMHFNDVVAAVVSAGLEHINPEDLPVAEIDQDTADSKYLCVKEVCHILSISRTTLNRWTQAMPPARGNKPQLSSFPPVSYLGCSVRYLRTDIEQWVRDNNLNIVF